MTNRIAKKVYYKIEFELASPLALSSGDNQVSDKDLMKDSKGNPYIPGSAIAGINRSFFLERPSIISKYFGELSEDGKGVKSRIVFYDAVIAGAEKYVISKRDSVALDAHKTAIKGAKFDMEVLESGVKFVTYIEQNLMQDETEEIAEEMVKHWLNQEVYLGAKTMRGYGAIKNVKVYKRAFDLQKAEDVTNWLDADMYRKEFWADCMAEEQADAENGYTLSLELKQAGGIAIRKYMTNVAENEKEAVPDYVQLTVSDGGEIYPVIPGTSWAGAFRHRMLALVPDMDEKVCFGFSDFETKKKGKSNIRFSETKLLGTTEKIYSRNAIDRFTGGTVDGALFTEKTCFGGETTLVISFEKLPSEDVRIALAASIADLHYGFLAVGGLTSVGRGCFEVKACNGVPVTEETIYETVLGIMKSWEGR